MGRPPVCPSQHANGRETAVESAAAAHHQFHQLPLWCILLALSPCHCTPTHEKKKPLVSTHTATACCPCYRFMYDTFVKHPGPRRCAGAFCTFTDSTKKAVGEKRFNQFCSNGVLNFMMINSPGGPRKADDSDHPLKEVGEEQKPNSSNMTPCGVLGWITALPLVWIGFLCCLALLSRQLDNSVETCSWLVRQCAV